jgi:hypothetical protein
MGPDYCGGEARRAPTADSSAPERAFVLRRL